MVINKFINYLKFHPWCTDAVAFQQTNIKTGLDAIWYGHFNCTGSEVHLNDCPYTAREDFVCSHSEDASVRCEDTNLCELRY